MTLPESEPATTTGPLPDDAPTTNPPAADSAAGPAQSSAAHAEAAPSGPSVFDGDPAKLAGMIRTHADRNNLSRIILGLAGGPGSGKSTLAGRLAAELDRSSQGVVVVPLDGFLLANRQLTGIGLQGRRGAPESFDEHGFLTLISRLRTPVAHEVYAPDFSAELDEPIAAAIRIDPATRYVIVDGSCLLLDEEPWTIARRMFDATWFVDPGEDIRVNRLVLRYIQQGRTPNAALKKATYGLNPEIAALVGPTRNRADLVVDF